MPLQIYNTLSRRKELFVPQQPGHVSFYVCGVTVYDDCHVGHARAYVAFDCMRRYLAYLGFTVQYVQNFTDIDDKIIARSAEKNLPWHDLVDTYTHRYFEDMTALNIEAASAYPKATDYIGRMQEMIHQLIQKDAAYVLDGDVYFSVKSFSDYGKLSKRVLEDLQSGARVEVNSRKRDPLDFVLWKAAKSGEPSWDSVWGAGRPGWHIECSAMVRDTLGDTIDIHGGGEDLIFPHHENEIAQSESCTGHPLAQFWVHNGFVQIRNQKMSKSLHNIVRVRDILTRFSGEAIRFYLLRTHYRAPLSFAETGIQESVQSLDRLHNAIGQYPSDSLESDLEWAVLENRFFEALDDDFNFAQAIGVLFECHHWVNRNQRGGASLQRLGRVLGLLENSPVVQAVSEHVQQLAEARQQARLVKNFAESDRLRAELLRAGYGVEDTASGFVLKAT